MPPTKDKSKLSYESIEWAENTQQMLQWRRNTLERKAYGYAKGRRGGQPGWTVVFRYKKSDYSDGKSGRGVTMDLAGRNMRVEHVDANLKAFTKLKTR